VRAGASLAEKSGSEPRLFVLLNCSFASDNAIHGEIPWLIKSMTDQFNG
jgi:hypothetical protein